MIIFIFYLYGAKSCLAHNREGFGAGRHQSIAENMAGLGCLEERKVLRLDLNTTSHRMTESRQLTPTQLRFIYIYMGETQFIKSHTAEVA